MARKLLLAMEQWLEIRQRIKKLPGPEDVSGFGVPTLGDLEEQLEAAEHEVAEVLASCRITR